MVKPSGLAAWEDTPMWPTNGTSMPSMEYSFPTISSLMTSPGITLSRRLKALWEDKETSPLPTSTEKSASWMEGGLASICLTQKTSPKKQNNFAMEIGEN